MREGRTLVPLYSDEPSGCVYSAIRGHGPISLCYGIPSYRYLARHPLSRAKGRPWMRAGAVKEDSTGRPNASLRPCHSTLGIATQLAIIELTIVSLQRSQWRAKIVHHAIVLASGHKLPNVGIFFHVKLTQNRFSSANQFVSDTLDLPLLHLLTIVVSFLPMGLSH